MITPEALRDAVAAAAGGPRLSPPGLGDIDARGRVAWIESTDGDIAVLLVAAGGRVLHRRELSRHDTRNWGYEGCSGRFVAWFGERIIVVTQECASSYLWSIDPDRRSDEVICMQRAWVIDGDLVVWVADAPGLLSTAALPSLDPRPPLPFRNAPENPHYRLKTGGGGWLDIFANFDGDCFIETLGLPTIEQRAAMAPSSDFFDLVGRRLFPGVPAAAVPSSARLLIEAATEPFVRAAPWRRPAWQPAPVWIPVYWHRHLLVAGRAAEAKDLLSVFDAIAAQLPESEAECGWDPRWSAQEGAVELAVRHVRRQARVQAAACRSGKLPQGRHCLFFDPAPGSETPGSRVDPTLLPPLVRQVFQDLVPTRPQRLDGRD